jgi:dihydrofolate synthase/folylpolyglutamate synthase
MNYDAAVRYLLTLGRELAAPTQAAAAKFDLENITVLVERLGRPDRTYPSAHIAGTNGKGSTAAFLESILRHGGFRTGLNTSPHLEKINERIRINGEEISDEAFAATFTRIQVLIEELLAAGKLRAHPTYFECVTAMAFEKAGILKPGVPIVLAEQRPEAREVILTRAKELSCSVIEPANAFRIEHETMQTGSFRARVTETASGTAFEIAPSLPGRFQFQNALNALAAARFLSHRGFQIPDDAITQGIARAVWPGRLEKLQSHPDVYLDGAHNPGAARELALFLEQNFAGRKIWLLYGALRDKAVDEVAGQLFPRASEVIFTEPRTSRAISATRLAEIAAHHASHFTVVSSAEQAFEQTLSKAATDDAIFITGSLYLVGQLRHYWKSRAQVDAR